MAREPIAEVKVRVSPDAPSLKRTERQITSALKGVERMASKGGLLSKSYTQPLGKITGAVGEFEKSLDASNARVIAFGASAGIIYNLGRALDFTVRAAIDLEHKLAEINVILKASNEGLAKFGDELFEVAKKTGQSFETVSSAALEFARQGLNVEETLTRTRDAMILTRLSGLDFASSVEAVTATINSFNQTVITSTQLVNKLANVDAAFAVSSADLAKAVSRVGSSAQDAGVSLDQLIAMVTTAQQVTARGGAVIGNSLKTIFTRLRRPAVISDLDAFGVTVRNLEGDVLPAIALLQNFANAYDGLSPAQQAVSAEMVGGVFQVNVLKAAIGDLGRQFSIYDRALNTSVGSTNEAILRNDELNKTMQTLINETLQNLLEVGAKIGEITLSPAIRNVLEGVNAALSGIKENAEGESMGVKIGEGMLTGIGNMLKGPGMVVLGALLGKLMYSFFKFSTDAVKTFAGMNEGAKKQAEIQMLVQNILIKNPNLIDAATSSEHAHSVISQKILDLVKARNIALAQTETLSASIARNISSADLKALNLAMGDGGGSTAGAWRPVEAARGFVPNFANKKQKEAAEVAGAISGGYKPGKVKTMHVPSFGQVTYNDAEKVKKFPNLSQPAIMPPKQSDAGKTYQKKFENRHGFNPYAASGLIPEDKDDSYAASGFIPSFAVKDEKLKSRWLEELYKGKNVQEVTKKYFTEEFEGAPRDVQERLEKKVHNAVTGANGWMNQPNNFPSFIGYLKNQASPRLERDDIFDESGKAAFNPKIVDRRKEFIEVPVAEGSIDVFPGPKHSMPVHASNAGVVGVFGGGGQVTKRIELNKLFEKAFGGKDVFDTNDAIEFSIGSGTIKTDQPKRKRGEGLYFPDKRFRNVYAHNLKNIGGKQTQEVKEGRALESAIFEWVNKFSDDSNEDGRRWDFTESNVHTMSQLANYAGLTGESGYKWIDSKRTVNTKEVVKSLARKYFEGTPQGGKALKAAFHKGISNLPEDQLGVMRLAEGYLDKKLVKEQGIQAKVSEQFQRAWAAAGSPAYAGQVPNFATRILDRDQLAQQMGLPLGHKKVTESFNSILNAAVQRGQVKETIVGTAGIGKTTYAVGQAGGRNFITDPAALSPSDQLLVVRAAKTVVDSPEFTHAGKITYLKGSKDVVKSMREKRAKDIRAGTDETGFGRDASQKFGSTSGIVTEALLGEKYPEKLRVLERQMDMSLQEVSEVAQMHELTNASATIGAFSPVTKGHEDMMKKGGEGGKVVAAVSKGVNREADVGLTSREKAYLVGLTDPNVMAIPSNTGIPQVFEHEGQAYRLPKETTNIILGADRVGGGDEDISGRFVDAGYKGVKAVHGRLGGVSGTKVRQAIIGGDVETLRANLSPNVFNTIEKNLPTLQERARLIQTRKDKANNDLGALHTAYEEFLAQHGKRKKKGEPANITEARTVFKKQEKHYKDRIKGYSGKAWQKMGLGLDLSAYEGLIPNFKYEGLHDEKDFGTTMVGRKGAMGLNMTEKQVTKATAGLKVIRGPEGETLIVGTDMRGRTGRMIASGLTARKIKKSGPVWRTMLNEVPHLFDGLAYDLVGGVVGAKFDPEGASGAVAGVKFEQEFAEAHGLPQAGAKKGSDFQVAEQVAKQLKTQKNLQLKLSLHERSKRDNTKVVDIASSFSKYLVDILSHNIKTYGLSNVTTPDRFQQAMAVLNANPAVKKDWEKYFGPMGMKSMGLVPNFAEATSGVYDWDDTLVNYPRSDNKGMPPIDTGVLSEEGKRLQASGEEFDVLTARKREAIPEIQRFASANGLKVRNIRAVGNAKWKPGQRAADKGEALGKYPKGTRFVDDDPENVKAGFLAGMDVDQVGDPYGPSWKREGKWRKEARGYAGGIIPTFHEGGVVPNFNKEQGAVLLGGEGVVTQKGMEALGQEGLKTLNKGFLPNAKGMVPNFAALYRGIAGPTQESVDKANIFSGKGKQHGYLNPALIKTYSQLEAYLLDHVMNPDISDLVSASKSKKVAGVFARPDKQDDQRNFGRVGTQKIGGGRVYTPQKVKALVTRMKRSGKSEQEAIRWFLEKGMTGTVGFDMQAFMTADAKKGEDSYLRRHGGEAEDWMWEEEVALLNRGSFSPSHGVPKLAKGLIPNLEMGDIMDMQDRVGVSPEFQAFQKERRKKIEFSQRRYFANRGIDQFELATALKTGSSGGSAANMPAGGIGKYVVFIGSNPNSRPSGMSDLGKPFTMTSEIEADKGAWLHGQIGEEFQRKGVKSNTNIGGETAEGAGRIGKNLADILPHLKPGEPFQMPAMGGKWGHRIHQVTFEADSAMPTKTYPWSQHSQRKSALRQDFKASLDKKFGKGKETRKRMQNVGGRMSLEQGRVMQDASYKVMEKHGPLAAMQRKRAGYSTGTSEAWDDFGEFQRKKGNASGLIPTFHEGGVVPNFNKEQEATLLGGEGVVTQKGMEALGREGLKTLNKGLVPNFENKAKSWSGTAHRTKKGLSGATQFITPAKSKGRGKAKGKRTPSVRAEGFFPNFAMRNFPKAIKVGHQKTMKIKEVAELEAMGYSKDQARAHNRRQKDLTESSSREFEFDLDEQEAAFISDENTKLNRVMSFIEAMRMVDPGFAASDIFKKVGFNPSDRAFEEAFGGGKLLFMFATQPSEKLEQTFEKIGKSQGTKGGDVHPEVVGSGLGFSKNEAGKKGYGGYGEYGADRHVGHYGTVASVFADPTDKKTHGTEGKSPVKAEDENKERAWRDYRNSAEGSIRQAINVLRAGMISRGLRFQDTDTSGMPFKEQVGRDRGGIATRDVVEAQETGAHIYEDLEGKQTTVSMMDAQVADIKEGGPSVFLGQDVSVKTQVEELRERHVRRQTTDPELVGELTEMEKEAFDMKMQRAAAQIIGDRLETSMGARGLPTQYVAEYGKRISDRVVAARAETGGRGAGLEVMAQGVGISDIDAIIPYVRLQASKKVEGNKAVLGYLQKQANSLRAGFEDYHALFSGEATLQASQRALAAPADKSITVQYDPNNQERHGRDKAKMYGVKKEKNKGTFFEEHQSGIEMKGMEDAGRLPATIPMPEKVKKALEWQKGGPWPVGPDEHMGKWIRGAGFHGPKDPRLLSNFSEYSEGRAELASFHKEAKSLNFRGLDDKPLWDEYWIDPPEAVGLSTLPSELWNLKSPASTTDTDNAHSRVREKMKAAAAAGLVPNFENKAKSWSGTASRSKKGPSGATQFITPAKSKGRGKKSGGRTPGIRASGFIPNFAGAAAFQRKMNLGKRNKRRGISTEVGGKTYTMKQKYTGITKKEELEQHKELIDNATKWEGEEGKPISPRQNQWIDTFALMGGDIAPTLGLTKGNIGWPRGDMPQMGKTRQQEFEADLRSGGKWDGDPAENPSLVARVLYGGLPFTPISVTTSKKKVGQLIATQADIYGGNVLGKLEGGFGVDSWYKQEKKSPPNFLTNPVMISQEQHILDGHHRWATLWARDIIDNNRIGGLTMTTNKIGLPILPLLKVANAFSEGSASGAGGMKKGAGKSQGLVPNFARDALKAAIGREKAAGFGSGQVKVGFDRRLRGSGGVGVYNTTEGSLTNAINMHLSGGNTIGGIQSQGAGASRGGVPNFAEGMETAMLMAELSMMSFALKDMQGSFKELWSDGLEPFQLALKQAGDAVEAYAAEHEQATIESKEAHEALATHTEAVQQEEQIIRDFEEGAERPDASRAPKQEELRNLEQQAKDVDFDMAGTETVSSDHIRKAREEMEKDLQELQDDLGSRVGTDREGYENTELTGKFKAKYGGQDPMDAYSRGEFSLEEFGDKGEKGVSQRASQLKNLDQRELKEKSRLLKEQIKELRKELDSSKGKARVTEAQRKKAEENLKAMEEEGTALREAADAASERADGANENSKAAEETYNKANKDLKKQGKGRGIGGRLQGFMDKGGATSLMAGVPMIAGIGSKMMDEENLQGKAAVEGGGNAVAMAATGAQMGSMLGPWGAAAGAVIGAFVGIVGAINDVKKAKLKEHLDKVTKKSEELGKQLKGIEEGGQAYMASLDKFQKMMGDTTGNLDAEDVKDVKQQMIKAMGEIPQEFQSRFAAAAGDAEKIKKIFGEITESLRNQKNDLDASGKVFETQMNMAYGELRMGNAYGLEGVLKGEGWGGDRTIFEREKGGGLTAQSKKAESMFKGIFRMEGAINKKEIAKRLEEGREVPSFEGGLTKTKLSGLADVLGEETMAALQGIEKSEDLRHAGDLLKDYFDQVKKGAKITAEIEEQTKKKNARDEAYNKIIKGLTNDVTNLNSTLSTVVKSVKARIFAIQQLDAKVKEFQINLSQADFKGAQGLAKPFMTKQQEIELNLEGKKFEIRETSINAMRKAVVGGGQKNLELILQKFSEVSDKSTKQITDLASKDNKATLGELQRNQKAQKAMLPVIEDALVSFAQSPDDEDAMSDVTTRMSAILVENGVLSSKAEAAATFLAAQVKANGSGMINELAKIVQNQMQQLTLEEQQAYWAQEQAKQTARIESFGGKGDFFAKGGATGLSKGFDSITDTLDSQITAAISGSIIDIGRANAKLLDTLLNKMNFDSLRDSMKGLAPLLSSAIAGRAKDIERQAGFARRITRAADPNLEVPEIDAEKIATDQISTQLKLNQLPDDVAAIRHNSEILNLLITKQAGDIASKNKTAFSEALRQNGIPQSMRESVIAGQTTAQQVDKAKKGISAVNAEGFINMIGASREVQEIAAALPEGFRAGMSTEMTIMTKSVREGLGINEKLIKLDATRIRASLAPLHTATHGLIERTNQLLAAKEAKKLAEDTNQAYENMIALQKRAEGDDATLQSTLDNLNSLQGGTEIKITDMNDKIDAWLARTGSTEATREIAAINKIFLRQLKDSGGEYGVESAGTSEATADLYTFMKMIANMADSWIPTVLHEDIEGNTLDAAPWATSEEDVQSAWAQMMPEYFKGLTGDMAKDFVKEAENVSYELSGFDKEEQGLLDTYVQEQLNTKIKSTTSHLESHNIELRHATEAWQGLSKKLNDFSVESSMIVEGKPGEQKMRMLTREESEGKAAAMAKFLKKGRGDETAAEYVQSLNLAKRQEPKMTKVETLTARELLGAQGTERFEEQQKTGGGTPITLQKYLSGENVQARERMRERDAARQRVREQRERGAKEKEAQTKEFTEQKVEAHKKVAGFVELGQKIEASPEYKKAMEAFAAVNGDAAKDMAKLRAGINKAYINMRGLATFYGKGARSHREYIKAESAYIMAIEKAQAELNRINKDTGKQFELIQPLGGTKDFRDLGQVKDLAEQAFDAWDPNAMTFPEVMSGHDKRGAVTPSDTLSGLTPDQENKIIALEEGRRGSSRDLTNLYFEKFKNLKVDTPEFNKANAAYKATREANKRHIDELISNVLTTDKQRAEFEAYKKQRSTKGEEYTEEDRVSMRAKVQEGFQGFKPTAFVERKQLLEQGPKPQQELMAQKDVFTARGRIVKVSKTLNSTLRAIEDIKQNVAGKGLASIREKITGQELEEATRAKRDPDKYIKDKFYELYPDSKDAPSELYMETERKRIQEWTDKMIPLLKADLDDAKEEKLKWTPQLAEKKIKELRDKYDEVVSGFMADLDQLLGAGWKEKFKLTLPSIDKPLPTGAYQHQTAATLMAGTPGRAAGIDPDAMITDPALLEMLDVGGEVEKILTEFMGKREIDTGTTNPQIAKLQEFMKRNQARMDKKGRQAGTLSPELSKELAGIIGASAKGRMDSGDLGGQKGSKKKGNNRRSPTEDQDATASWARAINEYIFELKTGDVNKSAQRGLIKDQGEMLRVILGQRSALDPTGDISDTTTQPLIKLFDPKNKSVADEREALNEALKKSASTPVKVTVALEKMQERLNQAQTLESDALTAFLMAAKAFQDAPEDEKDQAKKDLKRAAASRMEAYRLAQKAAFVYYNLARRVSPQGAAGGWELGMGGMGMAFSGVGSLLPKSNEALYSRTPASQVPPKPVAPSPSPSQPAAPQPPTVADTEAAIASRAEAVAKVLGIDLSDENKVRNLELIKEALHKQLLTLKQVENIIKSPEEIRELEGLVRLGGDRGKTAKTTLAQIVSLKQSFARYFSSLKQQDKIRQQLRKQSDPAGDAKIAKIKEPFDVEAALRQEIIAKQGAAAKELKSVGELIQLAILSVAKQTHTQVEKRLEQIDKEIGTITAQKKDIDLKGDLTSILVGAGKSEDEIKTYFTDGLKDLDEALQKRLDITVQTVSVFRAMLNAKEKVFKSEKDGLKLALKTKTIEHQRQELLKSLNLKQININQIVRDAGIYTDKLAKLLGVYASIQREAAEGKLVQAMASAKKLAFDSGKSTTVIQKGVTEFQEALFATVGDSSLKKSVGQSRAVTLSNVREKQTGQMLSGPGFELIKRQLQVAGKTDKGKKALEKMNIKDMGQVNDGDIRRLIINNKNSLMDIFESIELPDAILKSIRQYYTVLTEEQALRLSLRQSMQESNKIYSHQLSLYDRGVVTFEELTTAFTAMGKAAKSAGHLVSESKIKDQLRRTAQNTAQDFAQVMHEALNGVARTSKVKSAMDNLIKEYLENPALDVGQIPIADLMPALVPDPKKAEEDRKKVEGAKPLDGTTYMQGVDKLKGVLDNTFNHLQQVLKTGSGLLTADKIAWRGLQVIGSAVGALVANVKPSGKLTKDKLEGIQKAIADFTTAAKAKGSADASEKGKTPKEQLIKVNATVEAAKERVKTAKEKLEGTTRTGNTDVYTAQKEWDELKPSRSPYAIAKEQATKADTEHKQAKHELGLANKKYQELAKVPGSKAYRDKMGGPEGPKTRRKFAKDLNAAVSERDAAQTKVNATWAKRQEAKDKEWTAPGIDPDVHAKRETALERLRTTRQTAEDKKNEAQAEVTQATKALDAAKETARSERLRQEFPATNLQAIAAESVRAGGAHEAAVAAQKTAQAQLEAAAKAKTETKQAQQQAEQTFQTVPTDAPIPQGYIDEIVSAPIHAAAQELADSIDVLAAAEAHPGSTLGKEEKRSRKARDRAEGGNKHVRSMRKERAANIEAAKEQKDVAFLLLASLTSSAETRRREAEEAYRESGPKSEGQHAKRDAATKKAEAADLTYIQAQQKKAKTDEAVTQTAKDKIHTDEKLKTAAEAAAKKPIAGADPNVRLDLEKVLPDLGLDQLAFARRMEMGDTSKKERLEFQQSVLQDFAQRTPDEDQRKEAERRLGLLRKEKEAAAKQPGFAKKGGGLLLEHQKLLDLSSGLEGFTAEIQRVGVNGEITSTTLKALGMPIETINSSFNKLKVSTEAAGKRLDKSIVKKNIEDNARDMANKLNNAASDVNEGIGTTSKLSTNFTNALQFFIENGHIMSEKLRGESIEALKESQQANVVGFNNNLNNTMLLFKEGIVTTQQLGKSIEEANEAAIMAGEYGIKNFTDSLRQGFTYTRQDFNRDLNSMGKSFGKDFKQSVSGAFGEAIKGTKTLKEAFADAFASMADKMLDKALQMGVDSIFSAIGFNKGGLVKGYASGGMVLGGSGTKDDVPAYLSKGEYVIKKSAVNAYGREFFESLNKSNVVMAASGGEIAKLAAVRRSEINRSADLSKAGIRAFTYREDTDVDKEDWLGRPTGEKTKQTVRDYKVDLGKPMTSERIAAIQELIKKYPDVGKNLDREMLDESTMQIGKGRFKVHLKNKFVYDNLKRPDVGQYMVDQGLSATALTNENNPQNKYKFEKADAFFQYQKDKLDHLADYQKSLETHEREKQGRRFGFLFGAAAMAVGAGVTAWRGSAMAAGGISPDNIPALLTGGEYVISKDIVNKHGTQFFDKLNQGAISKYNVGGLVRSPGSTGGGMRSSLNMAGTDTGLNRNDRTASTITNNISISVSVDTQGNVTADTGDQGGAGRAGEPLSETQSRELAGKIKTTVLDVIIQEKRPGGMLYE